MHRGSKKPLGESFVIFQFLVAALIVALDQGVKLWGIEVLKPIGKIPVIPGVFNLRFTENTGAAFSILQGKTAFLIIIPLLAVAAMIYVLISKCIKSKIGSWGITLILAGAIGNLIDRIFRGAVVDMFDFELIRFPVFNVADIAVTIGAILFFIFAIFIYDDKSEKKK